MHYKSLKELPNEFKEACAAYIVLAGALDVPLDDVSIVPNTVSADGESDQIGVLVAVESRSFMLTVGKNPYPDEAEFIERWVDAITLLNNSSLEEKKAMIESTDVWSKANDIVWRLCVERSEPGRKKTNSAKRWLN